MRTRLENLPSPVALLHHGDADGILAAALLAEVLRSSGRAVTFASRAEFRADDLPVFEQALAGAGAGIFVEAQGMPPEYARLDSRVVNIDHHPHPDSTPIRRMLNPRRFDLAPIPCATQVVWDLLHDSLTPRGRFYAALAAVIDKAPDPARAILLAEKENLSRLADLEATFHAIQYASPLPERMAEYLATPRGAEEILAAEPFAGRRKRFQRAIEEASVREEGGLLLAEVAPIPDEALPPMRIASPLANRLSGENPERVVVVIEAHEDDRVRLSVRSPGGFDLGALLGEATRGIPASDGTGHERAGSARLPRRALPALLAHLSDSARAGATRGNRAEAVAR